VEDAIGSRVAAWRQADSANEENAELRQSKNDLTREISQLRAVVKDLQDKLVPFRLERAYSRAFNLLLTGQKIFSIKEVRAMLNIGLREAKDVVEGVFTDTNHPNLIALSNIFKVLGKDNVRDDQHGRLAQLLGNVSPEDMDSILAGMYHTKFES
jgi:ribosomal protein L7/L12